jgi:hypothetical protein
MSEKGFWSVVGEGMLRWQTNRITKQIAHIGSKRNKLREKSILLIRKREAMLGQELTQLPRSMSR